MIYKIRVLGDSVFSFLRLYYCIRNHSWSDVNDYLRNCIGLPVLVTSFQQHDMSTNGFWCLLCKILAIWLDDLHFCFIISLLEIYWLNASSWLNSLLLHAELMLIFQLFFRGFLSIVRSLNHLDLPWLRLLLLHHFLSFACINNDYLNMTPCFFPGCCIWFTNGCHTKWWARRHTSGIDAQAFFFTIGKFPALVNVVYILFPWPRFLIMVFLLIPTIKMK